MNVLYICNFTTLVAQIYFILDYRKVLPDDCNVSLSLHTTRYQGSAGFMSFGFQPKCAPVWQYKDSHSIL